MFGGPEHWTGWATQRKAPPWTPDLLPNRRFSFMASAGLVDASGNGSVITTPAGAPTLTAADAAYNNKPTYNFAGGKCLAVAIAGAARTNPFTVLYVGNALAASGTIMWVYDNQVAPILALYSQGNVAGRMVMNGAAVVIDASVDGRTKHAGSAVFNGASSELLMSGSALLTGSVGATAPSNNIYIGMGNGAAGPWQGKLAEVHVIDGVISAANRAQWHAYAVLQYAVAFAMVFGSAFSNVFG